MQLTATSRSTPDAHERHVGVVERAADRLVGKELLKVWFGDGFVRAQPAGIVGAREGYATLTDAISYARSAARSSLKVDDRGLVERGSSFAVAQAVDRFAVLQLDQLLAITRFEGRRGNFSPSSYEVHRGRDGAAIKAVIDGFGNLVRREGSFCFWR